MPWLAFTSFELLLLEPTKQHIADIATSDELPKSTAATSVISFCPLKVQQWPDKKPQTRPFLLQDPQVWTKTVGLPMFKNHHWDVICRFSELPTSADFTAGLAKDSGWRLDMIGKRTLQLNET